MRQTRVRPEGEKPWKRGPLLADCGRPSGVDLGFPNQRKGCLGVILAVLGGGGRLEMGVQDRNKGFAVSVRWKCKLSRNEGQRKQETGQQKGILRVWNSQVACPG